MAITNNNIYSLQLLRNGTAYATKDAAFEALQNAVALGSVVKKDGVAVLARYIYQEGDVKQIRTLVGYYAEASAMTQTSDAGSYMTIIDTEGTAAAVEELKEKIGTGVTTANTVTKQLQDLSGDSATSTSADTSVEGAKKYADEKISQTIDGLDYTDTAVTGNYVSKVDESNGVITVTREALPTVAAISEAGKPITAVSESLGAVSATAGTINAEYVNVTGSVFSSSTVQAALEEIETEYKAADAAIVGDATTSGNTLGKLEDRIEALDADAATYTIRKDTASLPAEIKERYTLVETKNGQSTDKQVTIDIPKDSHIVSINYITTGEHAQNLEYVYVDVSGNTQTTYVDMSSLVIEADFASGVTAIDGVVRGVVDANSEKDGQETPVAFLTVGENGFKVDGIKDEIDRKIAALDATVGDASVATGKHVAVQVVEADGVLTALTVSEDNIADADDLAELSAKTVTEIASSNASISATTATTADDTVSYDLVTDASKIQMSGFTSTDALSGIVTSNSITEAFQEVDRVITANEEVVSAALNDLEESKVENIVVNGVTGAFNNKIASVTIDGNDVVLGADYEKAASGTPITTADTVDQALGKLEAKVDAAVSGGVTAVTASSGITIDSSNINNPVVGVKLADATNISGVEENAIKFNNTDNGLYIDYLDCGTY